MKNLNGILERSKELHMPSIPSKFIIKEYSTHKTVDYSYNAEMHTYRIIQDDSILNISVKEARDHYNYTSSLWQDYVVYVDQNAIMID